MAGGLAAVGPRMQLVGQVVVKRSLGGAYARRAGSSVKQTSHSCYTMGLDEVAKRVVESRCARRAGRDKYTKLDFLCV